MEQKFTIELTELELYELFIDVEADYKMAECSLNCVSLSGSVFSYFKDRFDFYKILYSKLSNALLNNSSDKSDKNEVGE